MHFAARAFLLQCAPVAKVLPISEVQVRLRELVSALERSESDYVMLTRNGRPVAMLINYLEYARLRDMLDSLDHPQSRKHAENGAPALQRMLRSALRALKRR